VPDFLSSTDVGRLVLPLGEEGDPRSEVSERELRERREWEEEREAEAEALGAEGGGGGGGGGAGEEPPSFLTAPSFMASAVDEE